MRKLQGTPWGHDLGLLQQHAVLLGLDEVGRGCVAGPIVACAIALTHSTLQTLSGLPVMDSKKLSAKWRQQIVQQASTFEPHFASRSATDIDRFGIQACNQSIFLELLQQWPRETPALIDGGLPGFPANVRCLVKGESTSVAIALASIFAKVHRDALMDGLSQLHPAYGFGQHKGYGTKGHLQAIRTYGTLLGIHRQTFLSGLPTLRTLD